MRHAVRTERSSIVVCIQGILPAKSSYSSSLQQLWWTRNWSPQVHVVSMASTAHLQHRTIKIPGCRQETLLSGNARSATRVHFLCYPALVYSICHVARVAYCFSCPHSGHRNAVIAIIRLSSSLRPPGNFSSFAEPGCQWVCVVKTN